MRGKQYPVPSDQSSNTMSPPSEKPIPSSPGSSNRASAIEAAQTHAKSLGLPQTGVPPPPAVPCTEVTRRSSRVPHLQLLPFNFDKYPIKLSNQDKLEDEESEAQHQRYLESLNGMDEALYWKKEHEEVLRKAQEFMDSIGTASPKETP